MPEFHAAAAFNQPFQEAVDWFLSKQEKVMTRAQFDALAAAERAQAFTAAYVYKADELQRVYDAVQGAIEKGQTLNDFKKAVADILTRPWHRETVFRTNVLAAYGRGHWDQAQATKGARPYARYSALMDGRTRPRHAALHGLVYPLDHPFWKLYWPPWDYNCRCAAITLSQAEIDREGLKVSQDLPPAPGPRNNFVSPAAGNWQPDLGRYHPALRQEAILGLPKSALKPEHLELLQTLLWAQQEGGIPGYATWAKSVLERGQPRGEIYPVGNLPNWVMDKLEQKPQLALVVINDHVMLHLARDVKRLTGRTLSPAELMQIPEKFVSSEWFFDTQDPAVLMTWVRQADTWIKVVIRLDQRVGKGVTNRIVSAGTVKGHNIEVAIGMKNYNRHGRTPLPSIGLSALRKNPTRPSEFSSPHACFD